MQADVFREAIDRDPQLAKAVLGTLAEQFRRMVRQTKNLKLRSAAERVGCYCSSCRSGRARRTAASCPNEKHVIASEHA